MSNINYQALREIAKQATQGEWCAFISPGKHGTYAVHTPGDNHHGDIVDWPGFDEQKNAENNARYIAAFNPVVVQALLDEREAQSKRIAGLETNLAALAVENVGLNKFIKDDCFIYTSCNFAFFSGLFDAQFWAGSAQPKSPELTANY